MNNINISGNIVANPIVRGEEKKVANFTVAVRGYGDHTDFIRCTAFGKTAEYVEAYAKKGSKAMVEGSLHIGSYEKDGRKVSTADVYVRTIELTNKANDGETADVADTPADEGDFSVMAEDDMDLPFN